MKAGLMPGRGWGGGKKARLPHSVWSRCWGGSWLRHRNKGSFSISHEIVYRMGDKWAGAASGTK